MKDLESLNKDVEQINMKLARIERAISNILNVIIESDLTKDKVIQ